MPPFTEKEKGQNIYKFTEFNLSSHPCCYVETNETLSSAAGSESVLNYFLKVALSGQKWHIYKVFLLKAGCENTIFYRLSRIKSVLFILTFSLC